MMERENAPMSSETLASLLRQRYEQGGRDFRHADLSGVNLSGVNLSGASLAWADLSWADLTGANLSGANLLGANLLGANLSGADLSGANLSGVNLLGTSLSGVNLSWANLHNANLSGADLSGADLGNAELTGANLRNAHLSGAKNPPVSSHDFLAETLRQAAGEDAKRRSVAGLVLVSRDWCWKQFAVVAHEQWSSDTRAWIVQTLQMWPEVLGLLRHYGFLDAD
jgi:uncharacterized protein YjbI with pentapeptide repeats